MGWIWDFVRESVLDDLAKRVTAVMARQIQENEDRRVLDEILQKPHCALCGTREHWMLEMGVLDAAGNRTCVCCELTEANSHG